MITEYYRMPTAIANDLENGLLDLVDPATWKTPDQPNAVGTVVNIKSTPALIKADQQVLLKSEDETSSLQDGFLLEHSVLIIHQTRATHEKIRDVIYKVETGSVEAVDASR